MSETQQQSTVSPADIREAKQQQSQAEEIVNIPQLVNAFGRTYEIKRFSLGQFARSLNYITPLSAVLQVWARGQHMEKADWVPAIVGALSMSGDSMMGLISVATYEPIEWLEEGDKDPFEGIELLTVIIEKNLDFFSEKNISRLVAAIERLTPKIQALYGGISTI